MRKMFEFLSDGMSIDETKVSLLMILTLIYSIFLLVMYTLNGDISSNLVLVYQSLLASICGMNIASTITERFKNKL